MAPTPQQELRSLRPTFQQAPTNPSQWTLKKVKGAFIEARNLLETIYDVEIFQRGNPEFRWELHQRNNVQFPSRQDWQLVKDVLNRALDAAGAVSALRSTWIEMFRKATIDVLEASIAQNWHDGTTAYELWVEMYDRLLAANAPGSTKRVDIGDSRNRYTRRLTTTPNGGSRIVGRAP